MASTSSSRKSARMSRAKLSIDPPPRSLFPTIAPRRCAQCSRGGTAGSRLVAWEEVLLDPLRPAADIDQGLRHGFDHGFWPRAVKQRLVRVRDVLLYQRLVDPPHPPLPVSIRLADAVDHFKARPLGGQVSEQPLKGNRGCAVGVQQRDI